MLPLRCWCLIALLLGPSISPFLLYVQLYSPSSHSRPLSAAGGRSRRGLSLRHFMLLDIHVLHHLCSDSCLPHQTYFRSFARSFRGPATGSQH